MITILVTGSAGFIARNLIQVLRERTGVVIRECDRSCSMADLELFLSEADIIFHLAAVNRPQDPSEFDEVNTGVTRMICTSLERLGRAPKIVFSSSAQAGLDNPYGLSKRQAEDELRRFSAATGANVVIFRLQNVFGKWCRPNYNSVVSTFCHNVAHELPITVSDPNRELELVYIDDVVQAFLSELTTPTGSDGFHYDKVQPSYRVTLEMLAQRISSFKEIRANLILPDFDDRLVRYLYATYLSFLDPNDFGYSLKLRTDNRGSLAEFIKSPHFGQIFVSRTKPGITRGNHYHHTKVEKFLVLQGDALIRFRHLLSSDVLTYPVSGDEFKVVDIPPGFTHSIENVGETELVVLFWASEVFDSGAPDTNMCEV